MQEVLQAAGEWSGRNKPSHAFRSDTVVSQLWYLQKATKGDQS